MCGSYFVGGTAPYTLRPQFEVQLRIRRRRFFVWGSFSRPRFEAPRCRWKSVRRRLHSAQNDLRRTARARFAAPDAVVEHASNKNDEGFRGPFCFIHFRKMSRFTYLRRCSRSVRPVEQRRAGPRRGSDSTFPGEHDRGRGSRMWLKSMRLWNVNPSLGVVFRVFFKNIPGDRRSKLCTSPDIPPHSARIAYLQLQEEV